MCPRAPRPCRTPDHSVTLIRLIRDAWLDACITRLTVSRWPSPATPTRPELRKHGRTTARRGLQRLRPACFPFIHCRVLLSVPVSIGMDGGSAPALATPPSAVDMQLRPQRPAALETS
jgi:hypothetical protein